MWYNNEANPIVEVKRMGADLFSLPRLSRHTSGFSRHAPLVYHGSMTTKPTRRSAVTPYTTRDGSIIRELIHPDQSGARNQSLAEATIPPETETLLHRHGTSEEIYHVCAGRGVMTLGAETFEIGVGDSVLIPPGTPHKVRNTGDADLVILCCCAPAYSHDDTELL